MKDCTCFPFPELHSLVTATPIAVVVGKPSEQVVAAAAVLLLPRAAAVAASVHNTYIFDGRISHIIQL